jgi:hypothetical protein
MAPLTAGRKESRYPALVFRSLPISLGRVVASGQYLESADQKKKKKTKQNKTKQNKTKKSNQIKQKTKSKNKKGGMNEGGVCCQIWVQTC